MNGFRAWLLALLLACWPVGALAEGEVWVAYPSAVIDIAADGTVASFRMKESVGSELHPFIEREVKSWRFDPVIEDGQAIPVKARVDLTLMGIVLRDKSWEVGIADAKFFELSGQSSEEVVANAKSDLAPPAYPRFALRNGVMAKVTTILGVSREGKVVDAEIEELHLRAAHLIRNKKTRQRYAQKFEDAVRAALPSWKVHLDAGEFDDSGVARVRIPVTFEFDDMPWGRLHTVVSAPLDTPGPGSRRQEIASLDMGGAMTSDRIALQTELKPLPGG